eukprot:6210809-Pleurochrysis_carterae.AAC.2
MLDSSTAWCELGERLSELGERGVTSALDRFLPPELRQVDVGPASEDVLLVPLTLPVPTARNQRELQCKHGRGIERRQRLNYSQEVPHQHQTVDLMMLTVKAISRGGQHTGQT